MVLREKEYAHMCIYACIYVLCTFAVMFVCAIEDRLHCSREAVAVYVCAQM